MRASDCTDILKATFPYFGGKTQAARLVWDALGDVRNYVEPFAGSLGVLLNRPAPVIGPETVNDLNCFVVNAWRAIRDQPTEVARMATAIVSEVETEAQHAALLRSEKTLRDALGDPDYSDPIQAAWWIKGANEWIGTGWCEGNGPWIWTRENGWEKRSGTGVNRQLPHLGDAGRGVNRKLPHLGDAGKGVNRQLPHLGNAGTGEYQRRIEWATRWMHALRDRLVSVRVTCGDWQRVLGPSVTTKHAGVTGIFLDPPYDGTEEVYGAEASHGISANVREWCRTHAANDKIRIVLAGRGEEHDELLDQGWARREWSARKGYAKNGLHTSEVLWLSPHCLPS